ncbi:SIS domain-containing protein [Candidatus Marinimicrobia bacterium MT.SAG.3]|nr:SIS domain-containing protein [Candidatus Marinimicrobia bacterium MT.SAG.3]
MAFYEKYFKSIYENLQSVESSALDEAVALLNETSDAGGKVIFGGNGGSSAMASHVAVDLTKNAGIRAINFNESDLITCFANDYGYEEWIKKSIEFYADPDDMVVLISSSGRSQNVINAGKIAKERGMKLITFSGFQSDNPLRALGDLNFWVDNNEYNIVEMTHHVWLLAMIDRIIASRS